MLGYAEQLGSGIWEVWCCDCQKSIGTMNSSFLMAALRHAATKGGVKCPDCRKVSCVACGTPLNEKEMKGDSPYHCWFCKQEVSLDHEVPGQRPLSS
jgi:DNA-directed RNA polymerase subunit RPC12/RpoP